MATAVEKGGMAEGKRSSVPSMQCIYKSILIITISMQHASDALYNIDVGDARNNKVAKLQMPCRPSLQGNSHYA